MWVQFSLKKICELNLSMFSKQGWKLLSNPTSLFTRFLKVKYFFRRNFLYTSLCHNLSYIWRSLWSVSWICNLHSLKPSRQTPCWIRAWILETSLYYDPFLMAWMLLPFYQLHSLLVQVLMLGYGKLPWIVHVPLNMMFRYEKLVVDPIRNNMS